MLTPEAFAEQVQSVSRALWCIAAGVVGDRSAADDIVQESVMIALGKLEQFEADSNFLAWMGRIVRFVALNYGRKRISSASTMDPDSLERSAVRRRRSEAAQNLSTPQFLNGRGELLGDQRLFDDAVVQALNRLEAGARACLLLKTVLDMPYREIALALDMPEGTATSHVHRARAALRASLAPHFADQFVQPEIPHER